MTSCTINDRLFAVKPIVFNPSTPLTSEDIFIQELTALQTLSRLGQMLMLNEELPSVAFLMELHTSSYWHVLNRHAETALRNVCSHMPHTTIGPFSEMVFQEIGQIQSLLVQGLEKLYSALPDPQAQLWYNYLFVMWNSVNSMLQIKGSVSIH
jgi:hypothetical protein